MYNLQIVLTLSGGAIVAAAVGWESLINLINYLPPQVQALWFEFLLHLLLGSM